jgi:hypothetical protein
MDNQDANEVAMGHLACHIARKPFRVDNLSMGLSLLQEEPTGEWKQ